MVQCGLQRVSCPTWEVQSGLLSSGMTFRLFVSEAPGQDVRRLVWFICLHVKVEDSHSHASVPLPALVLFLCFIQALFRAKRRRPSGNKCSLFLSSANCARCLPWILQTTVVLVLKILMINKDSRK